MGTTVTEIMELADMHAYAQIADGTPARMLPRNLLQSKVEALIDLHTENEQLRAGYDAARLEIESLRERVQQLGQLARDVNSRRVVELEAQLEAIGAGGVEPLRKRECLHQISEPAQPAAQAAPEDASARFKAQHEFLIWNREQTPPPIESATEYSVFNQAVDFYIAARAAQEWK